MQGQENIQEILSKRLFLCQLLCALKVMAKGGNFVCNLFDVFTPFTAGLVYLLWRCFDKVCIHKPDTSRPANSERFQEIRTVQVIIICQVKHLDLLLHLVFEMIAKMS